jgi:hypothetical protein
MTMTTTKLFWAATLALALSSCRNEDYYSPGGHQLVCTARDGTEEFRSPPARHIFRERNGWAMYTGSRAGEASGYYEQSRDQFCHVIKLP